MENASRCTNFGSERWANLSTGLTKESKVSPGRLEMLGKCFGEFMGTLILVLLGDGVVANVLLKRSKAEGAGWMVIASGWAFAVMAGVFTAIACGSGDAHL